MNEQEQPYRSVTENGTEYWTLPNYEYHRLDGPAIIWHYGHTDWYIHDVVVYTTQLELSVGMSLPRFDDVVLVIKQINSILFQVLIGNRKQYLFSLYHSEYSNDEYFSEGYNDHE